MKTPSAPALLTMSGIDKSFPGVRALSQAALTLRAGEVHALMGENGAGKSTLIKVLTGLYPRDAGTMMLEGVSIDPKSPQEAEAVGISTVYPEVNLIPTLSVAENICLGREPVKIQTLTTTMYNLGVPSAVAPAPKAMVIVIVCLLQSPTFQAQMRSWRKSKVGGES